MDFSLLVQAGINVDELTKRLMGNTSLVRIFVKKFVEDANFTKLNQAFANKDYTQAELSSHTLKGMCGNLSITQLYQMFTRQVQLLREGQYDLAERMMENITPNYQLCVNNINLWLANG